jgi:ABC-type Fe3+ transport system substrate-binding protein
MLRQGAINIYASMPCPMKVPFKQLMTAFTAEYNATHQTPVYCPDVMDCSSEELGFLVRNTTDPDRLPDIIIAHNYEFFFEYPFEERFLKNGLFRGVTNPNDWDAMPAALRENFSRSNLGVLCFGSRSVIQDLTVAGFPDTISSWRELLTPAYEGQITVHGHLDKATFGFMYFINKHFGAEGIVRYAKNVADIKHFSQIINRLCSSDEFRTAINILPDVAAAKIPSSKKVKILELEEGKMLSPMIIVVKSSKMEQCREALDFFWSKPFRSLMSKGCILPDELEKDKPYFMPDFDVLAANYCSMEKEFNNLYLNNLNMDVIARRATEGGVCKG